MNLQIGDIVIYEAVGDYKKIGYTTLEGKTGEVVGHGFGFHLEVKFGDEVWRGIYHKNLKKVFDREPDWRL